MEYVQQFALGCELGYFEKWLDPIPKLCSEVKYSNHPLEVVQIPSRVPHTPSNHIPIIPNIILTPPDALQALSITPRPLQLKSTHKHIP